MAITFDNGAALSWSGSNPYTASYTTAGTNRFLFVGILIEQGAATVTGVTYAGVTMSLVGKKETGTGLNANTYLYALANPAVGANNVVVTCSSAPAYIFGGACSYNGVAQSGNPDASATTLATSESGNYTTDLATGTDNDWMVLFDAGYSGGSNPGAGTGSYFRVVASAYGVWGFFDSNALITPSGTDYSMQTTRGLGLGYRDVHVMASIKPYVAAYTVSGTIVDGSSNPIAGVTVSCTGQTDTTTAINGTYSFANVAAGTVTITPTKYAYSFSPTSVSPTISADTVENFTGTLLTTYSISGNAGVTGATVSYTGSKSGSVTAASDGSYTITGLLPGSYTLTPSKTHFVFSPTSASPTIVSSNVTGVTFTTTLPGIGIWQKQGIVISSTGFGGGSPAQPNVLYEANPQILSANPDGGIFKMWFDLDISGSGNGIGYAESSDGLAWTYYGSVLFTPTSTGTSQLTYSRMFKNAGTYYYYAGGLDGPIEVWTCTDGSGINFTQVNASALTHDGSGWDTSFCNLFNVAGFANGYWWGYYFGSTSSIGPVYAGQAYSTDLIHWTKSAGNPAITYDKPANFFWKQIHGKTYGWTIVQLPNTGSTDPQLPSDLMRFVGDSPEGPFTPQGFPSFYRTINAIEGVISQGGQVADSCMVEHDGNIYLYNTVGTVGNPGTIECSIAYNTTFEQLIQMYEGVLNIPIPQSTVQLQTLDSDALTTFGANWTDCETLWGGTSWASPQVVSSQIEGGTAGKNTGAFYTSLGTLTDQWSQITVRACAASSYVGVLLRTSLAGGYVLYWTGTLGSPGGFACKKITAGSFSSTIFDTSGSADGNGPNTVNAGDTLMGCIIGSVISFYHNENLVATVTDSTFASGAPGFFLVPITSEANAAVNDWSGGIYAHSIGGNSGIAGATITYIGGSVIADSGGDFIIPSLADGSQTITPSKTGYSFSPISASETVSGADITSVDFTAAQTQVATPTLSPGTGTYSSTQHVTISDTDHALAGFQIYYTTDGTTPDQTKIPYTYGTTIPISATCPLLAKAYATGYAVSAMANASYIINTPSGGGAAWWLLGGSLDLEDVPRRRGR